MCEDNSFLEATAKAHFQAHTNRECAAFTNFVFALCDNDESGDLDGCEGLACMVTLENQYRANNCPGFPAASVDACSANDCVYKLKPDYETMYPSFKDCKSKIQVQHIDWDAYDRGFSEVKDDTFVPAADTAALRMTVGDDSLSQAGASPGTEHASIGGGAYMEPGAKMERVITWSRKTQAIDAYNDAHHYRAENPLAHLHEDEAPVETDKLKSFHFFLQVASKKAPEDELAKEMTHDLEMNFNKIAPFGKEDTAKELQDHAAKTQV